MSRVAGLIILSLVAALISACTHPISREARRQVTPELSFADVKEDTEAARGERLLLGGLILDNRIESTGTTVEILRYRLDRWGEPIAVAEPAERFLITTERFLDPALFGPGRLVTLTAAVDGERSRPLGEILYRYPVFTLEEAYVWETPFRYGLYPAIDLYRPTYVGPEGAGRTSPYDPGYHAYPYTPYWIRP